MNGPQRLRQAFGRCAAEHRAALIAFLAAGDPHYDATVAAARDALAAGADIIELGSPFSDPIADGPVIQAAYERALAGGATTAGTLACAAQLAGAAPVVLMVAYNNVLAYGPRRFCRDAAAARVCGLLVPDLPLEDAAELRAETGDAGLATVFLAAPDSGPERTRAAAEASTGFLYLLRRRGITGAGGDAVELQGRVHEVRRAADVPVAIGFGIDTPAAAREAAQCADGVIVGSALVSAARVGDAVRGFVRALGKAPVSEVTA